MKQRKAKQEYEVTHAECGLCNGSGVMKHPTGLRTGKCSMCNGKGRVEVVRKKAVAR